MEITPYEVAMEIYLSLTDFENSGVQGQSETVQVMDNALQTSNVPRQFRYRKLRAEQQCGT